MEVFDVGRSFEVLLAISFMAIFVERGLAPLFESQYWVDVIERESMPTRKNVKVAVAVAVSVAACVVWDLDALSAIYGPGAKPLLGYVLTGLVVAGGAKGSTALFRDWLGMVSRHKKRRMAKEDGDASPGRAAGQRSVGQPSEFEARSTVDSEPPSGRSTSAP